MLDAHAMPIHLTLAAMNAEPPSDTPELDGLFEKLRTGSAEDRARTRGRIWAIWCSHPEDDAVHAMRSAVSALETGNLTNARGTLDAMVTQWPDWAEAWNKRATLRFIENRDGESLGDIAQTLEREPRHFGALGGFGQICLRAGDESSALLAFERLLVVDPSLDDVQRAVVALRRKVRHTIH